MVVDGWIRYKYFAAFHVSFRDVNINRIAAQDSVFQALLAFKDRLERSIDTVLQARRGEVFALDLLLDILKSVWRQDF